MRCLDWHQALPAQLSKPRPNTAGQRDLMRVLVAGRLAPMARGLPPKSPETLSFRPAQVREAR